MRHLVGNCQTCGVRPALLRFCAADAWVCPEVGEDGVKLGLDARHAALFGGDACAVHAFGKLVDLLAILARRPLDVRKLAFQRHDLSLAGEIVVNDVADRLTLGGSVVEPSVHLRAHLAHLAPHLGHEAEQVADGGLFRVGHVVSDHTTIIWDNFRFLNNRQVFRWPSGVLGCAGQCAGQRPSPSGTTHRLVGDRQPHAA